MTLTCLNGLHAIKKKDLFLITVPYKVTRAFYAKQENNYPSPKISANSFFKHPCRYLVDIYVNNEMRWEKFYLTTYILNRLRWDCADALILISAFTFFMRLLWFPGYPDTWHWWLLSNCTDLKDCFSSSNKNRVGTVLREIVRRRDGSG